MSDIHDIIEEDGIASVEGSTLPGVDYAVIGEEEAELQNIRVLYLKHYRDDYKVVGRSKNWMDQPFLLFEEK